MPSTSTSQPAADLVQHGDVVFVSLMVPDQAKALAFYKRVFNWKFQTKVTEWGKDVEIEGTSVQHGIDGDQAEPTLFLCYAVDDMTSALGAVRDADGSVGGTPIEEDGGLTCGCTDVMGTRFTLYQYLKPRDRRADGTARIEGDLVGVFVEASSPTQSAGFYQTVLGWAGPAADGTVPGVHPKFRIAKSQTDRPRALPEYGVSDLGAVSSTIKNSGGTVEAAQGTGLISCSDDQGTHFFCINA